MTTIITSQPNRFQARCVLCNVFVRPGDGQTWLYNGQRFTAHTHSQQDCLRALRAHQAQAERDANNGPLTLDDIANRPLTQRVLAPGHQPVEYGPSRTTGNRLEAEAVVVNPAPIAWGTRSNAYPARCWECRTSVEAHEGVLSAQRLPSGSWAVKHADLYVCERAAAEAGPKVEATPASTGDPAAHPQAHLPQVDKGYYAIGCLHADHRHQYDFIRIDKPVKGKWAGWTFAKRRAGDQWDRLSKADQEKAVKVIAADQHGAGLRYAQTIGSCYVCNRTLTTDESRRDGIGPECKKRQRRNTINNNPEV